MTNYITQRIRCIFKGILANLVSVPKSQTSPDFQGILRNFTSFFFEIMPDKVILDYKKSYFVYFENFCYCDFFTYGQFLLKIEKQENFQN